MKWLNHYALITAAVLVFSLSAAARENNEHTVTVTDPVQVGNVQLAPGTYQGVWQSTGPEVEVNFERDGKTVATIPGTLKTNDAQVIQDDIIRQKVSNKMFLREIDFGHNKAALMLNQG